MGINYKQLDKLLHDIQYVMADIQKERARHDKKMKDHMDDLMDCRSDILKLAEKIGKDGE